MSVLVVGLSHRTAPVALLERVALGPAGGRKLAHDVASAEHAVEAVVLSTCNRVEVYAEVEKFHGGVAVVSELLARHGDVALDALTPHLYVHYEDRAVQHLFEVTCGLDSMVVGESQILGQVRVGLRAAQEIGAAGRVLNELVQQALRVGKRAHAETGIDRAGQSLVSVGLDLGARALGDLRGRPALVVGAGSMSALAVATLARAGVSSVVIANRTPEHARRLGSTLGARTVGLADLTGAVCAADIVVSCTGAVGTVLSASLLREAQRRRGGRPQFVLDLALPRDVEPAAATVEGVTLADLETLAALGGVASTADVDAVRQIVTAEVAAFLGWQRAATVAPTVVALRAMAADVVDSELTRLAGRLPDLDARSRAEVGRTVQRVVDKLLHAPTVRVKELADGPAGRSYAAALRDLFDLDLREVEALTQARTQDGAP